MHFSCSFSLEVHLLWSDIPENLSWNFNLTWTFLLYSAIFFRFKNWCKITSRKKSSLTSVLSRAVQWVKLPFFSKKCIFGAEKGIISKSSFYTKMFSDPKYSFSVCQKYFFAVSKKVDIFHHSQPKYTGFYVNITL